MPFSMALPDPRRAPVRAKGAASSGARWIDRWLATVADLATLKDSHPMLDAVIDEIDGRMIRIGDHWLADFASCNYLGFDLDRDIIDSVPAYLDAWGTHPSWSRLLGSPVLYEQIEARLTELLGCENALVLPTITHIHTSVIPVLAGSGTILLDSRAHKTIYDGCREQRPPTPHLHGRRQQHDRQRARPAGVRPGGPRTRRAAVRR
jgi:8-amino-7-oxononanoate synthase